MIFGLCRLFDFILNFNFLCLALKPMSVLIHNGIKIKAARKECLITSGKWCIVPCKYSKPLVVCLQTTENSKLVTRG